MLEKMMEAENATLLGFKMGMDSVCIGGWGIGEMWRDFLGVCFLCVCFCFCFFVFVLFSPFLFLAQESHQVWESSYSPCAVGSRYDKSG